jgi:hypothetical protein
MKKYGREVKCFRFNPDGFNNYPVSEKLEGAVIIGDDSRTCFEILSEEFVKIMAIPKVCVMQDNFLVISG